MVSGTASVQSKNNDIVLASARTSKTHKKAASTVSVDDKVKAVLDILNGDNGASEESINAVVAYINNPENRISDKAGFLNDLEQALTDFKEPDPNDPDKVRIFIPEDIKNIMGYLRQETASSGNAQAAVTASANSTPSSSGITEVDFTSGALITGKPVLDQEMNGDDVKWQKSNWKNDGEIFNSTFKADHITFKNGMMIMKLDPCTEGCDGRPYASAEYRTVDETYKFGKYEIRMKAAKGTGLVAGSFFTYSGVYGKKDHNEIDFEVLGEDPTKIQLNYYYAGTGVSQENKQWLPLGFDASKGFHNYGFDWEPDHIEWFIDGKSIYKATNNIPQGACKIMTNVWAGNNEGWLGKKYNGGLPIRVNVDWIKYQPQ